jgi:hypothetical protein
MSAVEDRVRAALRERAEQSPISPDAWEQTLARTRRARRPERAGPWFRFAIPAAAAAAVVVIVAGAAVLAGHWGPSGGPRMPARSSPAPWRPAPPGQGDYLIRQNPPVSAIIPVMLTKGAQVTWTFLWFGYLKSDRGEGIQLCSETRGGGYFGSGGCGLAQLAMGQVARYSGGTGDIRMGVAGGQVTSVTAELPGGRGVPGVLVSGRGFPNKVWLVSYPSADTAQIVFRNASGLEVKHLTVAGDPPFPARPRSGGIVVFHYPAGSGHPKPGSMTAYLIGGRVGFWSSDNTESSVSAGAAAGPPAVGVSEGNRPPGAKLTEFYGYAHQNVARVALRLADGSQYGAQTFAAWPGSGLRLWAFSVPVGSLIRDVVMKGYDAAGHVVWQMHLGGQGSGG